ncbi:MAG: preprotein translocase subunit SecE [Dehalococcoidia bacterium]|nr:MAG: preprotein translocase subunit SecE [Dehalococcoidia bacterium]
MTQQIAATATKSRKRFAIFGETVSELKKVVWLSRREIVYLTTLVVLVAAVTGLVLGLLDLGFARLVNDVFLRR